MGSHGYGWIPDKPDHRDYYYHLNEKIYVASALPAKKDLWDQGICPPIWDQEQLGSCTAHGSLRAFLTEAKRQGESVPMLSRLMQYYDTRVLEGTTSSDAGGSVRDAIKVLNSYGCAPETDWPYNISQFAVKPPDSAYADAQKYMSIQYQTITVGGPGAPMRTAINNGLAICFGFSVPNSFEDGSWDPATQVLQLPSANEGFLGGHCVAVTGYDFSCTEYPIPFWWCDNSWNTSWGANGRFRMAWDWFDPFRGLANDLWVIQSTK